VEQHACQVLGGVHEVQKVHLGVKAY